MSHHHLFNVIVGDPPPRAMDVDRLIADQRRGQRRRRLAAAGGVAVAVAAAVLGTSALLGGRPSSAGPGGPPVVAGEPTATPPVTPPPYTPPADQPAFDREVSGRLSPVLRAAVLVAVPGAELVANQADPDAGPLQLVSNRAEMAPATAPSGYFGSADVHDAAGRGHVEVLIGFVAENEMRQVERSGGSMGYDVGPDIGPHTACPDEFGPADCQATTGPNGENIVTFPRFDAEPGAVTYRVEVTKPDGTQLILWSANFARNDAEGKSGRPDRPQPPLSVEQLVSIALDPEVTFYP